MRPLLLVLMCLWAAALGGCQSLATMLGANPSAAAPTVNVKVTQNANRGAGSMEDVDDRAAQEANGDVGASGNASSSQAATQTTTIDPEAIAKGAAELLKTATPGGQAATLADAALMEVANGDAEAGARLLKKAKAADKKDKPTPLPTPLPPSPPTPPVGTPAVVTPAVVTPAPTPVEDTP